MKLKVQDIEPNPTQPRKDFPEEGIKELADNIKAKGLIEPVEVSPLLHTGSEKKYQLVDGERRFRACRDYLHWEEIDVKVREDIKTEEDAALQSFIINNERFSYTPQDRNAYIFHLYETTNLSTRKLGEKLGKHHSFIDHCIEAHRFRQRLPPTLVGTLPLTHTALRQTAMIKDDNIRICLLQMIVDKKIKQDDYTIAKAANVIKEAPREVREAWVAGLLSLEAVEELNALMANKKDWESINELVPSMNESFYSGIMQDSKKIPIELKREALSMIEENKGDIDEVYSYYQEPTEQMLKKYSKETFEALSYWIAIAISSTPSILEKTQHLKDKPDLRIAVLDFRLDYLHKSIAVETFVDLLKKREVLVGGSSSSISGNDDYDSCSLIATKRCRD